MRELILSNVFDLEPGAELPEERAQASFNELDADNSGSITCGEMARGMAGDAAEAQEVVDMATRLVALFDDNGDGVISRDEFVSFLCPPKKPASADGEGEGEGKGEKEGGGEGEGKTGSEGPTPEEGAVIRNFLRQKILAQTDSGTFKEDNVRSVFKELDMDGSGEIDADELEAALLRFGIESASNAELQLVMQVLDLDRSGSVSESEFVALFTAAEDADDAVDPASGLSPHERKMVREFLLETVFKVSNAKQLREDTVMKVFKKADADESGTISRGEFQTAAKALGFGKISEAELDLCMAAFDQDGDGEVDYHEWSHFFFDGKLASCHAFGVTDPTKQKALLEVLHAANGHEDVHKRVRQFYSQHDKAKVEHTEHFVGKYYCQKL